MLTYVDEYLEDLEGDLSGLTTSSTIYVKAEYEDFVAYLKTGLNVKKPTLTVTASDEFEFESSYTVGATLPQLSTEGLSGVLEFDGEKTRIPASDLTVAFTDASGVVLTTVPQNGNIQIRASYRGNTVVVTGVGAITPVPAPEVASVKSVKLVDGFSLVKQQYTTVPSALSAIESITVVMNDTAKTEVVIPAADFEDGKVTAVYTTNEAGSAFEGKNDLSSATKLYVMAKYETFTAYAQVKLEDAVIDKLEVAVNLGKDVDVALYGGKVTLEPSITTTTNGTLAVTLDELEFVDTVTNKYVDSTTKKALTTEGGVTLDEKEHAYKAVLVKDGELIESEEFVIPAGISYINIAEDAISSTNFTVVVDKEKYIPIIDKPLSNNADYYTVALAESSASTAIVGPDDAKVEINIDEIVLVGDQVVDASSVAYARISYVGPEGKTVSGLVGFDVDGISATEGIENIKLTYPEDEGVSEKKLTANFQYNFDDFDIDKTSVTTYGNDTNLKLVGYMQGKVNLTEEGQIPEGNKTSGTFSTPWPADPAYTYTIFGSYTDVTTGKIAYFAYQFGN